MPELKAYTEGYVKGYEEGLREAFEEFLSLTNKGYTGREMQILAKGQRTAIMEKVERRRRKMLAEMEFAEPIEEAASRSKPPAAPAIAPGPVAAPPQSVDLQPGGIYVLKDRSLEGPMASLRTQLSSGGRALCILRTHPDALRKRFGIECQMVWLTKTESCPPEDASRLEFVSPTDLPRINTMIKSFLGENKGGYVLLEGMEYLVTQNEFKNVLKFLQVIRDQVILAKGVMMVPLDPSVLEERDLKALEREMA